MEGREGRMEVESTRGSLLGISTLAQLIEDGLVE